MIYMRAFMFALSHERPEFHQQRGRSVAQRLAPPLELVPQGDVPPRLDRVCTDRVSGTVHVLPRTTTYARPSRIPTRRTRRAGWITLAVAVVSAVALVWLA